MGYNDHLNDGRTEMLSVTCHNCKSDLIVFETDQKPGFRETERCICPVCKAVLDESREVEYSVIAK